MKLSENNAPLKRPHHNWTAFIAKEFTESIRTKRLLVMMCVFAILAIMGVFMARFIGEILAALISADGGAPFTIEVPPPVWTDSYAQVYSSFVEMGIIALIMLFMGAILREKRTGTIDLMMAKGLTPTVFVLSKFAVAAAITLLALFTAVFTAFGYTFLLFDYAGSIGNVLIGAVSFSVFLLMMLAITLLWSAVANSTAIAAVLGLGSFFVIMLLDIIPVVGRFTPSGIVSYSVALSVGDGQEMLIARIIVAIAISALSLLTAIWVLRRREG